MINLIGWGPFVFYRMEFKMTTLQSTHYSRVACRNNYTIQYQDSKKGFVQYFLKVNINGCELLYAVIKRLVPMDDFIIKEDILGFSTELTHINIYKIGL